MPGNETTRGAGRRNILLAGTLMAMLAASTAWADGIDPAADKVLKAMSDHLAGLKSFTVDYETGNEVVLTTGQKVEYTANGSIAAERPGKLRMSRKGAFVDADIIFDGKMVSFVGHKANVYAQLESPGPTIEDAVEEVRAATGLDAPGADLLAQNVYEVLSSEADEGVLVGTGYVGGVEADHLAFRGPVVDWQIWVAKGAEPLPLKYVITTKWVTGAPEYTVRFSNWNAAPTIDAAAFAFTPPAGAKQLPQLFADQIGEAIAGEVQ